ncbi:MAG: YeeE/YedE family protein, partial [Marinobacterium sp.]
NIQPVTGKIGLIAAGLLVGIGSALGTGCTSGHGICGLARRSFRSLIATLTFMLTAMITVFIVRHLVGGA